MSGVRPPSLPPVPPALASRVYALRQWLPALAVRVRDEELRWLAEQPGFDPADPTAAAAALVAAARASLATRRRMMDRADGLRAHCAGTDGAARLEALARHLRVTVPDARRLRGDLRALERDLDLDALLEREAGLAETHGARVEVAVQALGGLFPEMPVAAWEGAGVHGLLCDVAAWDPRPATRRAAVQVLARCTATLLAEGVALVARGLKLLRALSRDPTEDPWVRRRALDAVRGLEGGLARHWLEEALASEGRDAFLVRARAVELLLEAREPWVLAVAEARRADPSELVRASLADGLADRLAAGDGDALAPLRALLEEDPEPRIRARATRALAGLGERGLALVADRLHDVPLVASFAVEAAVEAARTETPLPAALVEALEEVRAGGPPALARRAALALHARRVVGGPAWAVAATVAEMRPEERRHVPLPEGVDVQGLADALAVLAADGFGFVVEPRHGGARVVRGEPQQATLWRLLHELRNPAPAKRQGHAHTLGRRDVGGIRVPPGALAEEAATGVPGQRVRVDREGGWVPTLPMVDDYLHATARDEVRVVTPEGTVHVRPPDTRAARWSARLRLTLRYGAFDRLRGDALEEADPALRGRYVAAMARLGFGTRLDGPPGPSRPLLGAAVNPVTYLVSMGANSLTHLAIVVGLLLAMAYGRATVAKQSVRAARRRVPLVIGGWGTRGKSGTERLKAAVFEGLGVPVFSKTTGCEAMFLHAPPGGRALELFLFRPYDKATIWEQIDVVRLASRMHTRALLWECMALNPAYVDLLQAGWMRDDLSTLTNAYPDHEDIQGPTGMDVATVLGGFAPPDALLLTTEANMLPVLTEEGRKRGTDVVPVDRAEIDLLPRDLLDRMPHAEHPGNVALAAAAAGALGVDEVEAVGLMAEHVVPDLGALIIYPRARHMGRDVVFANGMSANDTLSFRHNWRRTGFATHDHVAEPARWLVTVVNNRADRVARSRVFAQIVANDANAHRHVLIGTNLRGLVGYVDQAVTERLDGWVLDGDPARVDALFAHLRLVEPGELGDACGRRLGADGHARTGWLEAVAALHPPTVAELDAARDRAKAAGGAARRLEEACGPEGAGLADALLDATARWLAWRAARSSPAAAVRSLYRELVHASIVVVEDSKSSGDRTIATAVGTVPPGAEALIMGIQNIKGTGLDFAYQWVWWRQLHGHFEGLRAADPERRRKALDAVEATPLGSALACEALLDALAPLRSDPLLGLRAADLARRAEARRQALLAARTSGGAPRSPFQPLVRLVERILDPFDAILRKRRAEQVLDDLAEGRISHPRAQAELQRLTDRQKGGWLLARGKAGSVMKAR